MSRQLHSVDSGSWSDVLRRKNLPGSLGTNALLDDPYLLEVAWGAECILVGFLVVCLLFFPHILTAKCCRPKH